MPKRKSQRGVVLLADRRILTDHQGRSLVHPILWATGRIARVMKSTLSAETYSCTEAVDAMNWTRAMMAEIFDSSFDLRRCDECARRRAGAIVTHCRSVWDCITIERVNLAAR